MPTSQQQQLAAESLYRDANSLLYADNKPSEDAIDRVVSKMNKEYVLLRSHSQTQTESCPPFQYREETQLLAETCQRGRRRYHLHQRTQPCIQQEGSSSLHPVFDGTHTNLRRILDCPVLRQVHIRDSGQLRTRDCFVIFLFLSLYLYRVAWTRATILFSRLCPGGGLEYTVICQSSMMVSTVIDDPRLT